MSRREIGKPRVKLPVNPFLFKLSHNLLYQVALVAGASLIFLLLSLYCYLPPLGFAGVWWVLPGGFMLGVLAYWLLGVQRQRNLMPMDEIYPEVNDLVTKLAARRFLMCEPPPKVYLTNANIVAQTWSLRDESYIAVGRRFAHRLDGNPQLWSAILLHEMSHLRNGDIPLRFANLLVFFYTSLLLLGLGAWGILWGSGHLIPAEGLFLAILVYLLQLWTLFRARLGAETAADLRATLAIGDNRGVLEALRQLKLNRKAWQGGVLEAREAMLLNLADPSQQRLGSFLLYGIVPLLAATAFLLGAFYFYDGTLALLTNQSVSIASGLTIGAMGLVLYWALHDMGSSLIALGFKSLFPSILVLVLGESIAVAINAFIFPNALPNQLIALCIGMLLILGWALQLLLKEFKSGVTIPAVLHWHYGRLFIAGIVVPVFYALLYIIIVAAGAIVYCDELLSAITLTWFLTVSLWFWLESLRYLPRAITPANWSQPLAESPPDHAIDLSAFKPITREQEISMGCFDIGLISLLTGAACMGFSVMGGVMGAVYIVAIVFGFYSVNSGGRRSWGAWLQGATLRASHKKPPRGADSAMSILRLLFPSFHPVELDWAAVEEPRLSATATLWLGIVFASAGATMLFLRLAEVV